MRPNDPRKAMFHRQQLLDCRRVLARDYWKEREASLAFVQADPEDEVDMAVRTHTQDCFLAFSEIERRQLILIDEALRRLADGTYGNCTVCGRAIPTHRLKAIPWAPSCYACQVQQEMSEAPAAAEPAFVRIETAA
jgi:DnaK suppressor protein